MKTTHLITKIALCLCTLNVQAAGIADALHLVDDYPSCPLRVFDKTSRKPVEHAFVSVEWNKDVGLFESAIESCRSSYAGHAEQGIFVIPKARCSGLRHGSAIKILLKAPGYRLERYRIFRLPSPWRKKEYSSFAELNISQCSGAGHEIHLTRASIKEVLADYNTPSIRADIENIMSARQEYDYYRSVEKELMDLTPEMSAHEIRKSYCAARAANGIESQKSVCTTLSRALSRTTTLPSNTPEHINKTFNECINKLPEEKNIVSECIRNSEWFQKEFSW